MHRVRTLIAAALSCACVTALVAQSAPAVQSTAPAGPKLTPEAIMEYHSKAEPSGSADAGRPIYEKLCAACHRFGEMGTDVGPDLTTIASRFKRSDLLESILWPSKTISDQYQSEMLELKDGSIVTGVVVRETAIAVSIRTAESPERPVQVPKAKIASRATSTVSLMPPGLLDGYSHADIANLLTFVLSPPPAK